MRESYEPLESGSLLRSGGGGSDGESSARRSRSLRLRVAIGVVGVVVLLMLVALAMGGDGSGIERAPSAAAAEALDAEGPGSDLAVPEPQHANAHLRASHAPTVLVEKNERKDSKGKAQEAAKEDWKVGKDAKEKAAEAAGAIGQAKLTHQNAPPTRAARLTAKRALADPKGVCSHPDYSRTTLKTATESTMVALFSDLHGEKKFEASDVIPLENDYLVVYDNLYYIGKVERTMQFHGPGNSLLHSSPRREGDSGFEALVYIKERQSFLLVVESEEKKHDPFHGASIGLKKVNTTKEGEAAGRALDDGKGDGDKDEDKEDDTTFHAIIEEVKMPFLVENADSERGHDDRSSAPGSKHHGYELHERCPTEFTFSSGNKGFEGAVHVMHDDEIVLLGLCEGNFCEGGKRGRKPGHGRLVLMVKQGRNDTTAQPCVWATVGVLALPATAAFSDYSAVAILEASSSAVTGSHRVYHLAVTSQESSQVWIGQLRTGGNFSEWSLTDGVVYNFPRDSDCDIVYCNIEGISFVDDNLLVAVSDKMKSGGRQSYRCLAKDQSIHTFVLP